MGLINSNTQQQFPFPADAVFNAVLKAAPGAGFKITGSDPVIGRIYASTGMSLLSWGENVTIVVQPTGAGGSVLGIESELKVAFNLFGGIKHSANFNNLINAVSAQLQRR